jgi:Domain of unknown function (DUF4398)
MRLLSKWMLAMRATTTSLLLGALIVGCAAPAEQQALDQAGAAVERARGVPRVRALAAAELDRAEVALEHARAAARAGAPPDQVEHLAYVVSQRAALAEARAAERMAQAEIGKLQRALGQVLAHGRLEQDGFKRAPSRNHQQRRRLDQVRLEQDQPAWASSAHLDQPDKPLEEAQHERASVQEGQQTRALVQEAQRERARREALADGRPEQDRPAWASSTQRDEQANTPLEEARHERAPVQQDPQTRALLEEGERERVLGQRRLEQDGPSRVSSARPHPRAGALLEADQQERASMPQDLQSGVLLGEDQRERALGRVRLEQDGQAWGSSARLDQQLGAPLEADQQGRALVQQDPPTRALLEQDQREGARVQQDQQVSMPLEQHERAPVQEDQQTRSPLNQGQQERASVEQQARAPLKEDQRERASVNGDQQAHASVEEDQDAAPAEREDGTAIIGTIHQDITLSLAQLRFEGGSRPAIRSSSSRPWPSGWSVSLSLASRSRPSSICRSPRRGLRWSAASRWCARSSCNGA